MKRREILDRNKPPRLWVVLDERVLRSPVGGREVMRDQIAHIIELSQRLNIVLQIVPADRGAYLGLSGSVTILSFEEGPDVAYDEGHVGGRLIEEAKAVEKCGVRFDLIRASAPSRKNL
jgi:uncharacterized protein DUF5753